MFGCAGAYLNPSSLLTYICGGVQAVDSDGYTEVHDSFGLHLVLTRSATKNTYTGNVFVKGTNGKCGSSGVIASWDASRSGTKSCNNLFDDGTVVAALPDTSSYH